MSKKGLGYWLTAATTLLLASNAQGALITHNEYTLNTQTSVVSGQGLDWLRWDVTSGMSIDDAEEALSSGAIKGVDHGQGWRIATNVEMATLFGAFFSAGNWDTDESTTQVLELGYVRGDDLATSVSTQFFDLFGYTRTNEGRGGNANDYYYYTEAVFGDDLDGDNAYNSAALMDDHLYSVPFLGDVPQIGLANIQRDIINHDVRSQNRGIAFVRDSINSVIEVPEPPLLALITVLTFGMFWRRKTMSATRVTSVDE